MEILFIGKKNDPYAQIAADYLRLIYPESIFVFGSRGEKFPQELYDWRGDYIFSYLSQWVIPQTVLDNARMGGINWHPGPPEYPGIGCTNFAIYNKEKVFGITCHYMVSKVDTGKIIEVVRFPVIERDTVFSITQKCYASILNCFYRVVERIYNNEPIPDSPEKWTRKPFTRKELDELSKLTTTMSSEEVSNRIKATTYDKPWAFLEFEGRKFYLKE